MTIKKQLIWTLIVLTTSQLVGQFLPPFSIFIGTPFIVPMVTLFICFFLGDKTIHFDFELKSTIVITSTILSAVIDYYYAPGTHDQVGFAWQTMFWSYGLFVLFFGLTGAKLYWDFSFSKIGLNSWTALSIFELAIFISIPLIFHRLLWTGQIVGIIGNC
jgi:hypothetical protein